jgi:iron complex outermembrane receptor protein
LLLSGSPGDRFRLRRVFLVGLNYGFLGGRLPGAVEYYYKETADLLFPTPVPAGSNLTNIVTTNVGTVRNRGVELNVSAQVFEASAGNGFAWNAGFNASTNDNELLKINDFSAPDFQGISTGGIAGGVGNTIQILQEGEPVNSFFVYRHKEGPDGDPLVEGEFGLGRHLYESQTGWTNLGDRGRIRNPETVKRKVLQSDGGNNTDQR